MPIAFDVSEVVSMADQLRDIGANADAKLAGQFDAWVDATVDAMRDEVPKDEWDMHDSITVERDGLTATIGPTNTDDRGRPIAFFVNYGAGSRAPNDFIGRTAARAAETAADFDVADVL